MDDDRKAYLDTVLIGGREPASIVVVDYDAAWAARFEIPVAKDGTTVLKYRIRVKW